MPSNHEYKDHVGSKEDVMVAGREGTPEDEAFIYATWRNGSYYGPNRMKPAAEFFRAKTEEIREILSRAKQVHQGIRIACIKDAPEVILGYAIFTGDGHLEWIFVKEQFRGKKIGTFLTPRLKTVSPEMTKAGAAIVNKKNLTIKGEYPNE